MTVTTHRVIGLALGFSLVVAACGSSSKPATPTTTTASTTTVSSTTTPASTTTSPAALSTAVFPTAASGVRYSSPVAVARAFALDYLHFVDPVVGEFQQGDSRSGEVPIRTKAEGTSLGPLTTVIVRQLDDSWWVLGAATANIMLTQPAALATIHSPVRLRGSSTAFEATVNVSVRQDDVAQPLVESTMMGGSNGQMGPFDATFTFAAPTSRDGAIVLSTTSAIDGHVAEATVVRVRLAGS